MYIMKSCCDIGSGGNIFDMSCIGRLLYIVTYVDKC